MHGTVKYETETQMNADEMSKREREEFEFQEYDLQSLVRQLQSLVVIIIIMIKKNNYNNIHNNYYVTIRKLKNRMKRERNKNGKQK